MNMKKWILDIMTFQARKALPILSFPSVQMLGISVRRLIESGESQTKGMAAVAERCPAVASVSMMDLSVEAECFGAKIRISEDEVPTVIGAVIQSSEDAEALEIPPVGSGRTGRYVEAVRGAKTLITDRPVLAGVIGPFSLSGRLMDMTEIMVSCYDEPEMVHTVLQKVTRFLQQYILAYKMAGADGVVLAEPAAGLLSPDLCREFSAPYVKKIVDAIQDDSFIVVYHNCGGAVNRQVPEILSTGAAAYHFGNAVDMEEMLKKMPADVLVMGNLDPVSVFRSGTPGSVRKATLELMEHCCSYKNFLISSGCDIPPAAPWENIDAFFHAVDEFYRSR